MIEWIAVGWLVVAGLRVLIWAAVDAYVAIVHPEREAPSLARRRARVEIAQEQHRITGVTGVGQAFADRLATRIANPPERPRWFEEAAQYASTLLADEFARRRQARADKEDRKRGAVPADKRCWRCDVGKAAHDNGLCNPCNLLVHERCGGCGELVLAVRLEDGKCSSCRSTSTPPPDVPDATYRPPAPGSATGPARLVVP